MARSSTSTAPTEYQRANQNRRVIGKVSNDMQRTVDHERVVQALNQQRQALIASGVDKSRLPVLNSRMSPADAANAQAHMNQLNGASVADSRNPNQPQPGFGGYAPSGVGKRTGMPLPQPAGPLDGIPAAQIRGSTPADIQSAAKGGPTGTALVQDNAMNAAVGAARGTDQSVQTPYGPVSSRFLKTGTPETQATVTDTGVSRPAADPWQVALVKKYPNIGVAGTPENKAFVENYKQAEASGGSFDPAVDGHRIADSMFGMKEGDTALSPQTDSTSPTSETAQTAQTAQATKLNPQYPPNSTAAMGAKARQALGSEAEDMKTSMLRVGVPVVNAVNSARNLFRGFTGEAPIPETVAPAYMASSLPDDAKKPDPVTQLQPFPYSANPSMPTTVQADAPPVSLPPGYNYTPPSAKGAVQGASNGFTSYTPDDDLIAFSANPSEDQFKKKLREPTTLDYTV